MADLAKHIGTEVGAAKAWLSFDQTVPSINDDFNITSVSDDAAGEYTPTIANDMTDGNYAVSCGIWDNLGTVSDAFHCLGQNGSASNLPAAGVYELTANTGKTGPPTDFPSNSNVVFGDLA